MNILVLNYKQMNSPVKENIFTKLKKMHEKKKNQGKSPVKENIFTKLKKNHKKEFTDGPFSQDGEIFCSYD